MRPLMNPRGIAVVGASPRRNRGNRVLDNLVKVGYPGTIVCVHPKAEEVQGFPAYPDPASIPVPVDVMVVATPAAVVPDVVRQGWEAGIPAAVVLGSGFGEAGEVGRERHEVLADLASQGMLICGPNCYGVLNVAERAAPFSGTIPDSLLAGDVAVVSQSGGLSAQLPTQLMRNRAVGFSYLVSCGNQIGVGVEQYVEYLLEDDGTNVVFCFVEGFKDPTRLRTIGQRSRELGKPVVVMKVGRSDNAQRAAQAHTGSLAGSHAVAQASFRQYGIVEVDSLNDLFETASVFQAAGRRRVGGRLAILTGSGGEAGHVSDAAQAEDVQVGAFAQDTVQRLSDALPDFGTPHNPLDATGAVYDDPAVFPKLIGALGDDTETDVVAVTLGFHGRPEFVDAMCAVAARSDKLMVAYSPMSGTGVDVEQVAALRSSGIPYVEGTETTMRALRCVIDFHADRGLDFSTSVPRPERAREALDGVGSGIVDVSRSAALLEAYGIAFASARVVSSVDEAMAAAEQIGWPVAIKADAATVAHKADIGAVRLGCASPDQVRDAFAGVRKAVEVAGAGHDVDIVVQRMAEPGLEMIVGAKYEQPFGPTVLVGAGGIFVEVMEDVAIGMPPIRPETAAGLIRRLRSSRLFDGARGAAVTPVGGLAELVTRVGQLAVDLGPALVGLDLNPVIVQPGSGDVLAVDVMIELDWEA